MATSDLHASQKQCIYAVQNIENNVVGWNKSGDWWGSNSEKCITRRVHICRWVTWGWHELAWSLERGGNNAGGASVGQAGEMEKMRMSRRSVQERYRRSMRERARERGCTVPTGEGKAWAKTHKLCNPWCSEVRGWEVIRFQPVIRGLAIFVPLLQMPYHMPNIVTRDFLN